MNALETHFTSLGFTPNETTIYLTLRSLGQSRAGTIIKKTGLHRNLVYLALEGLVDKGVVSKALQGKVSVFEANSLESFMDIVAAKQKAVEKIQEELQKEAHVPKDIKIFSGFDGILQARERSLSLPSKETVYIFGGSHDATAEPFQKIWKQYHHKRLQKGIHCKMLVDQSVSKEFLASRNMMPATEAKYVPFEQDLPAWFEIFGDTVSIGIPEDEPVVFTLKSKKLAESLKGYFEYLWNK